MTDQRRKHRQELQVPYAALSKRGKAKTNNELFNAMLNRGKHPRRVFGALAAFPKEAGV